MRYRVVWLGRDYINETVRTCESLAEALDLYRRVPKEVIYAHIQELPERTWAETQAEGLLGEVADRWRTHYE